MNQGFVSTGMTEKSEKTADMKPVHLFLMDAMGPVNSDELIKELPIRLLINYRVTDFESEINYNIRLYNPWGQLASTYTGMLDSWEKDFTVLLPIKHIAGKWVLKILISGSSNLQRNYNIFLP
jgi:hypothetical protein